MILLYLLQAGPAKLTGKLDTAALVSIGFPTVQFPRRNGAEHDEWRRFWMIPNSFRDEGKIQCPRRAEALLKNHVIRKCPPEILRSQMV